MMLTVHVTPRDVSEGVCSDPSRCAVARAVARALQLDGDDVPLDLRGRVLVAEDEAHLFGVACPLPRAARTFIRRFDRGPICPTCSDDSQTRLYCPDCGGSGHRPGTRQTISFQLPVPALVFQRIGARAPMLSEGPRESRR